MDNKCWFCNENDAVDEKSYIVSLKKHDNRKDIKTVEIARCERCAENHKKSHNLSNIMYFIELILVAVAYFVIKLDLLYIAVAYVLFINPLSALSKKIREKTAEPYKSVVHIDKNEEVIALFEEGYIDNRRY